MTTAERALCTWAIDPVHSRLDFSLEHMGFSTYRASFRAVVAVLCMPAWRVPSWSMAPPACMASKSFLRSSLPAVAWSGGTPLRGRCCRRAAAPA